VWYRHNQRWLQSSREGAEASKSGSFKDEQEWGKKCYMEYRLPPPRRMRPRRDREMAKKQINSMAEAEKVAPGSD
jgi:hypothetical protein